MLILALVHHSNRIIYNEKKTYTWMIISIATRCQPRHFNLLCTAQTQTYRWASAAEMAPTESDELGRVAGAIIICFSKVVMRTLASQDDGTFKAISPSFVQLGVSTISSRRLDQKIALALVHIPVCGSGAFAGTSPGDSYHVVNWIESVFFEDVSFDISNTLVTGDYMLDRSR